MKKTNVLWVILCLVFLAIFNVLFFMIGGATHNASVWISYGFIHFAYFMLLLTPKLTNKNKSAAVLGFSLVSISTVYFLVQFVTGIIFILVSPESYKAALSVQLCIAGLYAIMLISNMIANQHTAEAEEKRRYEVSYVKTASVQLKGLLDSVGDKDLQKKLERAYDAIYSSPVKSHPNLAQMENRILQSIDELEDALKTENKENMVSLANSLLSAIFGAS